MDPEMTSGASEVADDSAAFEAALNDVEAGRESSSNSQSQTSSTDDTGSGSSQDNQQTGDGGKTSSQDDTASRKENSRKFYELRQRRKQEATALRRQIADLEKKRDELLKDTQNPNAKEQADRLDERIDDMSALAYDQQVKQFEDEVYETFGQEYGESFIALHKKYAGWVNEHEPEVLDYANRPFGKIFLAEWYNRIDKSPKLRKSWESYNGYEKNVALSKLYRKVVQVMEGNGQPTGQTQKGSGAAGATGNSTPANIPTPSGGRGGASRSAPSADDFGAQLDFIEQRDRRK